MYSFTASMLYFSCVEIGTMGDGSATEPGRKRRKTSGGSVMLSNSYLLRTP